MPKFKTKLRQLLARVGSHIKNVFHQTLSLLSITVIIPFLHPGKLSHIIAGKLGEEFAAQYLAKDGYFILARNWKYRRNEVDIIASKDHKIVFFEVKTRRKDVFEVFTAAGAVGPEKKASIRKVALAYQRRFHRKLKNMKVRHVRFETIGVEYERVGWTIRARVILGGALEL